MPVYEFKGLSREGKNLKGIIDANSPSDARAKLRKENVFVTEIHENIGGSSGSSTGRGTSFGQSVSTEDLALMTQQLSTLLSSGVPMVDSLSALIEQMENARLKRVVSEIKGKVNEGGTLADAMAAHPKIFSNLYINMIRAGEASGQLEEVLNKLTTFTEDQNRLKGKIFSAMAYPIFMLVVGFIAVIIIFTVVLPKLIEFYDNLNKALPLPTQILIGISESLTSYWYIFLGVGLAIIFGTRAYLKSPSGSYKFDRFKLTMPIFGPLFRMVAVARFANTLSTLLSSGVPILVSMDIVKKVIDNQVMLEVVEKVRTNIAEGDSIAEPLRRSKEFPPLVTHMIAVGEKTGELEAMLEKVAQTYNNQAETKIGAITSLIEPLMILIMVAVIGAIVISVMLPIFQMGNAF
ncbi:MAG: type II secretion system inner membrane protein GspF [Bdellovibrionales bacterium]|nr:type II secretion system inner membrane protein GspF [Bdellovibrionales bacterium]